MKQACDLVTGLGRAYREGRLDRRLGIYLAPEVLVIDEMGYLQQSRDDMDVVRVNDQQPAVLQAGGDLQKTPG